MNSRFDVGVLNNASGVKDWKWDNVKQKRLVPRCWFAPGADVRFAGCNTKTFASAWDSAIARGHAQTWGTTQVMQTRDGKAWFQEQNNGYQGTPASTAWVGYDAFWGLPKWVRYDHH